MLNPKAKIGWIKIASRRYGGVIYGEQVREALSQDFDIETVNIDSGYFRRGYARAPELFCNLLRVKGEKDLWIRDLYPLITLGWDKTSGKNMAIVYHIDFSTSSPAAKLPNFFLERLIYHKLKNVDFIVTISEYWKNYFLEKGYKNVYKICPAFDPSDFDISPEEVSDFRKKYQLADKPIIYIGNCQKAKGVVETYRALKDLDVFLVTSGERMVKIPTLNFNLDRRDYLKMLKASSAAITMSKFQEGWCMTAHEAMLLKTPVIGSGKGGMKEFLEGGRQIICQNPDFLREKVKDLLENPKVREEMGEIGFNFAKEFTREKFQKEWVGLIKQLLSND